MIWYWYILLLQKGSVTIYPWCWWKIEWNVLPGNLTVSQPSFVAWFFGIYMDLLLFLSCSTARLGPTHLWHILGHGPSVGAALRVLTWFNYMTVGIEIISSFGVSTLLQIDGWNHALIEQIKNHLVWSLVEVVLQTHILGTGQRSYLSSQLGSHFLPAVSSGGSEPCLSFMHWKLGTSFVKDMKAWVSFQKTSDLNSKQPNFSTQKKQLFFQVWGVWSFREGIPKLWDFAATNVKIFSAPYSTKVPPKEMDSFKPASSHDKTLPVSD